MEKKIAYLGKLRWACRFVVALATSMSVWANWLHSEQALWPVIINCAPPVLVLIGYEMVSRVPGWEGPWWHPRRWVSPMAMVAITGIGAWLSYWHQKAAFLHYAHDPQTARLLPLAIDGLMVIASVKVMDLTHKIEQLENFLEASKVSTYRPPAAKDIEQPKKKDAGKEPSKKERIVDALRRFPEMKPADVASLTGAQLNYVYAVIKELNQSEPALA